MSTQLDDESVQSGVTEMISNIAQVVLKTLRRRVPRLDEETAQVVAALVGTVVAEHPAFRAAILYGSVARHEERPLDDQAPSDVDLLLLFTPRPDEHGLTFQEHRAVFASVGRARASLPEPPRDIQALPAAYDLVGWDELFVENVARDGVLLWAEGELPPSLTAISRGRAPTGPTARSASQ